MRLIEASGKAYSVVQKTSGKTVFTDDRATCIRFILGFDKASFKYVDLRLVNPEGKEENWHED